MAAKWFNSLDTNSNKNLKIMSAHIWTYSDPPIYQFFLWKVFKKSKIAQIYYYDPQSAGINMQSPQNDLTLWTLTLENGLEYWSSDSESDDEEALTEGTAVEL